jgi:hypothetical protein
MERTLLRPVFKRAVALPVRSVEGLLNAVASAQLGSSSAQVDRAFG